MNTSFVISVSPATVILTVIVYIPGTEKSIPESGGLKSLGYLKVKVFGAGDAGILNPPVELTVALKAAVGFGPLTKILTTSPSIFSITVLLFVNVISKETLSFGQNGSPPTIDTLVVATST